MIRNSDLNLVATYRVAAMSLSASNQLLFLLADHLKTSVDIDMATFLLLADEAEAVAA